VVFLLQNAIRTGFKFKDSFGRPSLLQSRGSVYTLGPIGVENGTIVERTTRPPTRGNVAIEAVEPEKKEVADVPNLTAMVDSLSLAEAALQPVAVPPELKGKDRTKALATAARATEQLQAIQAFTEKMKADFASVLPGYIFDRLSREQKIAYLRSPESKALPFGDRLRVQGTEILVLGKDDYDPPDPIGDDRTAVQEWIKALNARYLADNDKMIGTMKDGKFSIGRFEEKDGVFTRVHGAKRDVPIVCGTGAVGSAEVGKIAAYTDIRKIGIPADMPKKITWTRCDIMELLAREQNNIVWYTPEEMDVLKTKTGV